MTNITFKDCEALITTLSQHVITWPRDYKTLFMLNSTAHEILTADWKKYDEFSCLIYSVVIIIMIMLIIELHLSFMSMVNVMLSWVKHEKIFYNLGLGVCYLHDGSKKKSPGVGVTNVFTSTALRVRFIPEFLRKHIATCAFQGDGHPSLPSLRIRPYLRITQSALR